MSKDLRELLPEEIAGLMRDMGEPSFRAGQVFAWLQKAGVSSYQDMSNIPAGLRQRLEASCPLPRPRLLRRQESGDGTKKYLFALRDGEAIESVLMSHREETGHIRRTLCLSSQVGCPMGCVFCATGGLGLKRNLEAGEIVSQVMEVRAIEKMNIHNLVYMGMGEPLLNMEAVLKSIRLLNHAQGQKIGIRRITMSTCGLPDQIRRLAAEGLDLVLAVSLHGPDDEIRGRLMPVNKRYPLRELLAACRYYAAAGNRRITFEYIMIKDVNVGEEAAAKLGKLLAGIPCNINLIPVNPGAHGFVRPGRPEQLRFCQALGRAGLTAVIREEKGTDIAGACGQLAAGKTAAQPVNGGDWPAL
jgi:23S rRNA (adenine2503-C2)-methyltransferase